jgi:hypothetical protein
MLTELKSRPRRNEHEGHVSSGSAKEVSGGPMGKFNIKSALDRNEPGHDENRRPKEDWRKGSLAVCKELIKLRQTSASSATK